MATVVIRELNSVAILRFLHQNQNCIITYQNIGKYCSISWNVSIGGGEHNYNCASTKQIWQKMFGERTQREDYITYEKSNIGNDVWIGNGVIVLQGINIGDGAIIGAGAVVTHDVEPYNIVYGVPAKPLKKRFDDRFCRDLLRIKWWDFPVETVKEIYSLLMMPMCNEVIDRLFSIKLSIEERQNANF